MARGRPSLGGSNSKRLSVEDETTNVGDAREHSSDGGGIEEKPRPPPHSSIHVALLKLTDAASRDPSLGWAVSTMHSACAALDSSTSQRASWGWEEGKSFFPPTPGPGFLNMYDGGWSTVLDFLELRQVLQLKLVSREVGRRVEECLTVLSLNGLEELSHCWVGPAALKSLAKFKNAKTLHWYVGLPYAPQKKTPGEDDEGKDDQLPPHSQETPLVGDTLMVWTYLLAHLNVEGITLTEGARTDEIALDTLWRRILPFCAPQLKRLALAYEGYSVCSETEDHAPIDIKAFAVMLAVQRPFPNLRELHMEMASMSINQQRTLVRGISRSGLLSRLESLTLGGGTTAYCRAAVGPGREFVRALKKHGAPNLKLLWIQRLDIWDAFEEFSEALSPELCPVLEEFYMDLTLDCDDVKSLSACLHKFPSCLKTLGMLVMAIEGRTTTGQFQEITPEPYIHLLSDALLAHPRPELECIDLSLHYESAPPVRSDDDDEHLQVAMEEDNARSRLLREHAALEDDSNATVKATVDVIPLLHALQKGAAPNLKHLQLPSTKLPGEAWIQLLETLPMLPYLQTMDLSGNLLSLEEIKSLVETLQKCKWVYEVIVEECIISRDEVKEYEAITDQMKGRCRFQWKSVEDATAEQQEYQNNLRTHLRLDEDEDSDSEDDDEEWRDIADIDEDGDEEEPQVGNPVVVGVAWADHGDVDDAMQVADEAEVTFGDVVHHMLDWDMNDNGESADSDGQIPAELEDDDE